MKSHFISNFIRVLIHGWQTFDISLLKMAFPLLLFYTDAIYLFRLYLMPFYRWFYSFCRLIPWWRHDLEWARSWVGLLNLDYGVIAIVSCFDCQCLIEWLLSATYWLSFLYLYIFLWCWLLKIFIFSNVASLTLSLRKHIAWSSIGLVYYDSWWIIFIETYWRIVLTIALKRAWTIYTSTFLKAIRIAPSSCWWAFPHLFKHPWWPRCLYFGWWVCIIDIASICFFSTRAFWGHDWIFVLYKVPELL